MQIFQPISTKKVLGLIFCSLLASGCEKKSSDSFDKLLNETIKASDAALEQVGSLKTEDAKQEFKKLGQYEYKVLAFKKDVPVLELESSLVLYGQKGYDCSSPVIRELEMLFVCKKRPESLLRYVPQTFVGRP